MGKVEDCKNEAKRLRDTNNPHMLEIAAGDEAAAEEEMRRLTYLAGIRNQTPEQVAEGEQRSTPRWPLATWLLVQFTLLVLLVVAIFHGFGDALRVLFSLVSLW